VEIILTHENADFDAVASLLAAHKLNPASVPVLPTRLNQNVADFMTLYQNGLPFVRQADFRAKNVQHITLVDTQRLTGIRGLRRKTPLRMIDHHPLSRALQPHESFTGDTLGATTTLLIEDIRAQSLVLTSLEATLLALGIYEDTGSFVYGTTTSRDLQAASWLLEQNVAIETIRRFLIHPLSDEQQRLLETLLASAETRKIEGYTITVAATRVESYISEISSITHRLRDILDPAALFVAVEMPGSIQLVGRATGSVIDAGEIARIFGGGGHEFASAASVRDRTLDETVSIIWEQLQQNIRPATRVADLMSYGVQTVDPNRPIGEVAPQLRRIGHEGFPIVEAARVIGLLTRRDADRAIEHELNNLTVREVMTSGEVTLNKNDSVSKLEQIVVESGWGQIPVVDEKGHLIGIVTRTDLINHWARSHPPVPSQPKIISISQIEEVLSENVNILIQAIARYSQETDIPLYMVGGAVRDLMLHRRNLDIDLVVEGDAIQLANDLKAQYGGEVSSFRPFGTAKWILNEQVANALNVNVGTLPHYIDFASARNEFYEHPTALPTVYDSSIKLDLQRRDFTINTIAIQVSPADTFGRVLDFYGGLNDLQAGVVRVLHSLSFVDDPTRILRAVRLSQRLKFNIEPRTVELIQTALPMLRRITGERLRNELTLLFREQGPEHGLSQLQSLGALEAIHPAFQINTDAISACFQAARVEKYPWPIEPPLEMKDVYWHILAASIVPEQLLDWCERLMFGRSDTESFLDLSNLIHKNDQLNDEQARPSQLTRSLEGKTELALLTAWLILDSPLARERIQRYMLEWRNVQPAADGFALRAKGIPPGPCYAVVLNRLRDAWLDGDLHSSEAEQQLLTELTDEFCHDSA
jgi:tRNA nucleotidyltransferase (CCA-adding enzyme)